MIKWGKLEIELEAVVLISMVLVFAIGMIGWVLTK